MLDCEAMSRLTVPAFRVAVARKLVREYGLSQNRTAALLEIRQASVSKYLSSSRSDRVGSAAAYIASWGLEDALVKMALSNIPKNALSDALEKAASDPKLLRHIVSTKGLQLVKKSKF